MKARNFSICHIRKLYKLSCHNCEYYETCPEHPKARKKDQEKKERKWTDREMAIAKDTTKTAKQVAALTGRSEQAVLNWRKKNGITKNKRKKHEDLYIWKN